MNINEGNKVVVLFFLKACDKVVPDETKSSDSTCDITAGEIPSDGGSAFKRDGDVSLLFFFLQFEGASAASVCDGGEETRRR